jgi:hypothetical protein
MTTLIIIFGFLGLFLAFSVPKYVQNDPKSLIFKRFFEVLLAIYLIFEGFALFYIIKHSI